MYGTPVLKGTLESCTEKCPKCAILSRKCDIYHNVRVYHESVTFLTLGGCPNIPVGGCPNIPVGGCPNIRGWVSNVPRWGVQCTTVGCPMYHGPRWGCPMYHGPRWGLPWTTVGLPWTTVGITMDHGVGIPWTTVWVYHGPR